MGGRREVSIKPHRPVTSSDLKQERLFFLESVLTNIFPTGCSKIIIRPLYCKIRRIRDEDWGGSWPMANL